MAEDTKEDYGGFDTDEELTAIDKQYATQTDIPRRIHIIGTGSIGKLVAHSLRGIPNPPPVTLLFHRYKLLEAWEKSKKEITIQEGGYDVPRGGFDAGLMPPTYYEHGAEAGKQYEDTMRNEGVRPHEAAERVKQRLPSKDTSGGSGGRRGSGAGKYSDFISDEPIHNLIVCTKGGLTLSALRAVKHRIDAATSICFLQNGMGVIEDLNKQLFTDPKTRPNYMQGIITHGANVPPEKAAQDPFYAVHAGHGTIAVGLMPRDDAASDEQEGGDEKSRKPVKWAPGSRYLLRTLTRSPVLCAVGFTPMELLQQQLEKLATNCVVNPMTSLMDCRNGRLLYNFPLTRTARLMVAEISHVIRSLPELENVPNVAHRFSAERLETLVVSVADKTQNNISSMLADVRAGRQTEIEFINGYIVRRGEEIGVKCMVNYAVMQMVIGKQKIRQVEAQEDVPMEGGKLGSRRELNPDV